VNSRPRPRALLTLSLFAVIFAATGGGRAQDIETGTSRRDLTGGASATRPAHANPPKQIYVNKTQVVTVTKKVLVTPTTGTLSVFSSEPNASILVEPKQGVGEGKVGTIPAGELGFIFNDLKPGVYRVAASLDGYEPVEKEINVVRNKTTPVTLELKPVTQNVAVNTNVKAGEIRYALVEAYKDPRTGETKYAPRGATIVVPIQQGRAVLANLRAGTYGVDIRPDPSEVGYRTLLGTITVPGNESVTVELEHLMSTESFYASWTRDEWELPPGWQIASRLLTANGRGVAFPRDNRFRYYADFHLVSDVRMSNGVAASFILRAADARNYYLVQLTGEKADEPFLLRGFVVKNGVPQLLQSIPINHLAQTIQPKQFFKIHIRMTGNRMNVSIEDSQTGQSLPLGILTDSYQTFRTGAPGIAADGNERSDYGSFAVCTPECR
jgi:PEGA domain